MECDIGSGALLFCTCSAIIRASADHAAYAYVSLVRNNFILEIEKLMNVHHCMFNRRCMSYFFQIQPQQLVGEWRTNRRGIFSVR